MKLYKTTSGILLQKEGAFYRLQEAWDELINREELFGYLAKLADGSQAVSLPADTSLDKYILQAPIGSQEVWAAGVTYLRSRDARMEESKASGSADCYQKVYEAERPELFFKALPHRVAAHGEVVYIRKDAVWNVPEPELTLFINASGRIQGYTIGNDMSSRDIEGENPLYLPQAKVYERSAALGPCLYVQEEPLSKETQITVSITRRSQEVFADSIRLNRMKRSFEELASYLFRGCDFRNGVFLMTGTGMVPPPAFTLAAGDEVTIHIEGIGVLRNHVAVKPQSATIAKGGAQFQSY